MNCKPGDLAYIADACPYQGKIVEIIEMRGSFYDHDNCWWVRARWEMDCIGGPETEFLYPDAPLRPISGVPVHDEQHDEVPA